MIGADLKANLLIPARHDRETKSGGKNPMVPEVLSGNGGDVKISATLPVYFFANGNSRNCFAVPQYIWPFLVL